MKTILKYLLVLPLLVITHLAFAESGTAMKSGKTLGIFQSISLPEDGSIQSFTASLGKTRVTKEGVMLTNADETLDPSAYVLPVPGISYPVAAPLKQDVALNYATLLQNAQKSLLTPQIKEYMKKLGAVEASFYFRQLIKVEGAATKKAIVWSMFIDATGRVRIANPRIISDIPQYVHLTYTSKAIVDGLPTSWAYPNAGTYNWNLVDKLLNNLTSDTVVNTNGAYDEPVAQTVKPYTLPYPNGCDIDDEGDMSCDPDWSLRCLIDQTSYSSCPTGYSDVKTIMADTGSDGAYVDYVRSLSPVYDQVLTGYEPDGEEIYEDVARVSVSVDERKWIKGKIYFFISPTGGKKFHMKARIGYELLKQIERYQVNTDGSYALVGSSSEVTISPTQNVDKTVTVPGGSKCVNFAFNVIDPFSTNQVYDYRNDTVNGLPLSRYVYVSPLNCY